MSASECAARPNAMVTKISPVFHTVVAYSHQRARFCNSACLVSATVPVTRGRCCGLLSAGSLVHAGFVVEVADRFELEGGVFNVEVAGEAGLELVEDLGA